MHARCAVCSNLWNVSAAAPVPVPYICPRCARRRNTTLATAKYKMHKEL